MTNPSWDPDQYARFGHDRSRAFHDLLARVGATDPGLVLDLGCGNGPLTLQLADRWPGAEVVGVDLSAAMLQAAGTLDRAGRVRWQQADLADWSPAELGTAPDVIVANAVLQWVPGHLGVLHRWVDALAPGGWLAVQVPGNHDAPSHALMREVAEESPHRARLRAALARQQVGVPADYLAVLAGRCEHLDVWETTYLHVLDPQNRQDSPVLEWVRGTGLRPVLDALPDEQERAEFVRVYDARLRQAYPRTEAGVVLPFRRLFAVGQRAGAR